MKGGGLKMESYSVQAVLSVADRSFTSNMKKAADAVEALDTGSQKASGSVTDIAKGIGVFKALSIAGNTLQNSLDGAVNRFDTMTRFPKVLQQMGYSANESNQSIQKLSDGIQQVPTSLDGIAASTQKIAVLTGDLNKATNTALALNNAFLSSGATSADAERGLTQYVQMLSKGSVDMESWRTLQETMGYALSETAKQLGITSGNSLELYAAIQSGEISFDKFNSALIECSTRTGGFAEKAAAASAGIKTSFTNLGISVTRGMANTIQSVDEALGRLNGSSIDGMINALTEKINVFFNGVSNGAGTVIRSLDLLGPSLAVAAGGFVAFKSAMVIQDQCKALQTAMAGVKTTIDAFRNAGQLATDAMKAQELAAGALARAKETEAIAVKAAAAAQEAETLAEISTAEAMKARTAAERATTAETKVRTAEEKLATATTKLRQKEEILAAAATKSQAAQLKAAADVTKAKAAVDKKAAALEKAKAQAAKVGASSAKLNARAETLEAAAAKAQARAAEKAVNASVAKTKAEKAETRATERSAAAEAKNAAAAEASNIVQAKGSALAIAKTAVLGIFAGELNVVTAAQWAWNASMTANPIGTVIVAATALIGVFTGISVAMDKMDTKSQAIQRSQKSVVESSKNLVESLESSKRSYKETTSDIEASAKANGELAGKISDLAGKESRSAQEKATLKTYVDQLNSSMEGLNLKYDEQTDALNMSTDAIKRKVEAYKAEAEAQAAQERYIEIKKEQMRIEEDLAAIATQRNTLEEEWQNKACQGIIASYKYTTAVEDLYEQERALKEQKDGLAASEEHLEQVVAESQKAQAEAVSEAVESQTLSMEDLTEAQQEAVQSLNEVWQSYADQATNMFDTLSDKSELSVAEMTKNLEENQRVISNWADNITILAERGVDQGLLEQLRQAGPESAGYVNAMVQASDAELQRLSDVYSNGGQTATNALKTVFDTSEIPEAAMTGFVARMETSLNQQIAAADFASLGRNIPEGMENGITEGTGSVWTAATAMATGVSETVANTLGIHSPSVVFQGYGTNLIEGLVIGIQGQSGNLNSALTAMMTSAGKTAVDALNKQLNGMTSLTSVSFAKIPEAAKSSMSQTSAAIAAGMNACNQKVTSGMKIAQTSAKSGMTAMNTTVKSGMTAIQASARSGMNQFTREIDSGMGKAKNSASQGRNGIRSSLSGLPSDLHNIGYNASIGLANGINSGAGTAISAANRLANTIASTMRNALEVHSPSKVTTEIGEYTGIGAAEGLLNAIPQVEHASKKVAAAMLPGTISEFASRINKSQSGRYVVDARRIAEGGMDYDYLIEGMKEAISELQIQVEAVISARDAGDATTKYVDRNMGNRAAMKRRYAAGV